MPLLVRGLIEEEADGSSDTEDESGGGLEEVSAGIRTGTVGAVTVIVSEAAATALLPSAIPLLEEG